ncbi:Ubiquitin carboxyl-terminal hydrolase 42 [Trebouxia sp. C0010 RCD-2024]
MFPALTGRGLHFCGIAQPLARIGNASCFVSATIQAWVHTPNEANIAEKAWKRRCGCTPNTPCLLCYLGLRVASSHGKRSDGAEGKIALWVLQRLHLLLPESSKAKRNKATPADPNQVKLSDRQWKMCDCADFQSAYLDKAREYDSIATAQGGVNMVDHVFGSQLVQDVTCPSCCTSQTFQQWTSVTTPLIWHGQVCTTIGRSLDCLLDSEECQMRCDKCGRNSECRKGSKWYLGGNVITMQLDRHPFGMPKALHHVAFPHELDLGPWVHPSSPELAEGASLIYDLVTVVTHKGKTSQGGHYVAVCRLGDGAAKCLAEAAADTAARSVAKRAAEDGTTLWALCDDDHEVQLCTWDQVAQLQAAVLVWNCRHPRQEPLPMPQPRTFVHQGPQAQSLPLPHTDSGTAHLPLPAPTRPPTPAHSCVGHVQQPTCPVVLSSPPDNPPPPPVLGSAVVQAESGQLSTPAEPSFGAAYVVPTQLPAVSIPTSNASVAPVDTRNVPTISNSSAAAAGGDRRTAAASGGQPTSLSLSQSPTMPGQAVTQVESGKWVDQLQYVPKDRTKASRAVAAKGPVKTTASGATAGSGPIITKASGAVAAKGPRNAKAKARTGIAGGENCSTTAGAQTRSRTAAASKQQQTIAFEVEDTAMSARKRPRSDSGDSSNTLPGSKRVALQPASCNEDDEMLDIEALPTIMECAAPCTRAAKKRKAAQKGKRQGRKAWR